MPKFAGNRQKLNVIKMASENITHSGELRQLLESRHDMYNRLDFIEDDPISIPHSFTKKEDIELSGFFSSIIAWGNRKQIIKSAKRMMFMMDNSPFDFILNHSDEDLKALLDFRHRTFGGDDLIYFVTAMRSVLLEYGCLENAFTGESVKEEAGGMLAISNFRKAFLRTEGSGKSSRHVSDPEKNSAAKRLNMFLRWMVRADDRGVDFGLWKNLTPSQLQCPLDVHSGATARKLGLLQRKQNDRKAVEELTNNLKTFDPNDPVRFDFALFGIGIFEKGK